MKPTAEQRRAALPVQAHARKMAELHVENRRRQVGTLAQLDSLHGVSEHVLQLLADHCTLRAFAPGAMILNERSASSFLYLVLRGSVMLTLRDRNRREVLVGTYNRGDCFGEGPLFGDVFRGVQVRTATTCYLLQLPFDVVHEAMRESEDLAARLRLLYRHHLVASTLGRVPIFSELSSVERNNVARLLHLRHIERGNLVISEGQSGSALFLIESGQCAVEHGETVVAHLDEGTFFGEISLLTDKPHNASIRALTPLDVLELPREAFKELLERQPSINRQLTAIVEQRLNDRRAPDESQVQLVGNALERGWLRGSHLLVRDTAKCEPGCTRCVDACTTRFGAPRLSANRAMMNEMEVLDSCRQCRVGAECAEACPENAIQWNNNGALVITDACTSCGECVGACPYQAITMRPLPGARKGPLDAIRKRIAQFRASDLTIMLEPQKATHRPEKCDYCHGYDDLACVTACPNNALRLVPVEELFPF